MIKTAFKPLIIGLAAILIPFTVACSGGGGGGGGSLPLAGVWIGAGYDDQAMAFAEYRVVVDANKNITGVLVDGVDQGIIGTIQKTSAKVVFSFSLSDGTAGCFIVDKGANYSFLASEAEDFFAVLQKGATSLPTYMPTDVFDKSYSGKEVEFNGNFDLQDTNASSLQILAGGGFSGTSGAMSFNHALGGELTVFDIDHGAWSGRYEANGPGGFSEGEVHVFLSPDKKFIGAGACPDMGNYPGDCGFFAWKLN